MRGNQYLGRPVKGYFLNGQVCNKNDTNNRLLQSLNNQLDMQIFIFNRACNGVYLY